jgi:hypothetical protein
MERKKFEETQKLISRYVMVIADVKNSKVILKTRDGRKAFQHLLNDTREILEKPEVIQFEDSGVKFRLIRKGDCIGFVFDKNTDYDNISSILNEWDDLLKKSGLKFHRNQCAIPSLDNYMEHFIYLEKDSKEADIENTDTTKNKTINISLEVDVEDFIEEDYVRTEIEHAINSYDWHVNSISVKTNKQNITKEEVHEAREILFKFATISEKLDLIEGRKLNKKLGKFIDDK